MANVSNAVKFYMTMLIGNRVSFFKIGHCKKAGEYREGY